MKRTIWIALAGCVILALSGCVKKEWYPLTSVDKQMIPYKMGDTVRFINEKGGASLLVVDKDVKYKERFSETFIEILYEVREVHLSSEHGDLSFLVDVAGWRWVNVAKYVLVGIGSFGGEYQYDSKGSFKNFGDGNTRYFYDSIEINNYVYHNVAMKEEWRENVYWQLYYNTDYGILQVKEGEKAIFTLVP